MQEPSDHALGRSRGGFGTKIHLVCDSHGFIVAIHLTAGQRHESKALEPTMARRLFHRRRGQSRWPRRVAADKGYSYRASGSGLGGDGSEPSFPREPTSHETSTSTRPPIGSDTSSSRSWAGTRSIVPWAPVTRNSQSTMLLYGWWPLWTRPSIGYSQTERSRHTHTPCGIHLTNEKQSLAGSPQRSAESSSLALRTNRSPPVALHPASRRRSYFRLQSARTL